MNVLVQRDLHEEGVFSHPRRDLCVKLLTSSIKDGTHVKSNQILMCCTMPTLILQLTSMSTSPLDVDITAPRPRQSYAEMP